MNYETLEAVIVARLQGLAGIEVIPLPENDNDFKTPYTDAKVTVAYNSSTFELSEDSFFVSQPEVIIMQLVFWSRRLRGSTGIYQIINAVQSNLQGWEPAAGTDKCKKIELGHIKFESHVDDLWTYSQFITTETMKIGQPDPVIEVISTEIKIKDEKGTITIDVP